MLFLLAVVGAVVAVSATFRVTTSSFVASLALACSATVAFAEWKSFGKAGISGTLVSLKQYFMTAEIFPNWLWQHLQNGY